MASCESGFGDRDVDHHVSHGDQIHLPEHSSPERPSRPIGFAVPGRKPERSYRLARDAPIESDPVETLRRTSLYDRHEALGARFVPFAGWEMPVLYSSIVEEHRAVRASAGVFDVSHMGELEVAGAGSHAYLQDRLSNDLDKIVPGQAQYTLLMNERGGITDDLIAYRTGQESYLLIVNAANVSHDHIVLERARDVSDDWALLAVQGPAALELLELELKRFTFSEITMFGVDCLAAGTGYTGESGCEIGCRSEDAPALWDGVTGRGVTPCGLGARDTLRIEAAYPLHGNDIGPERTPIEADLQFACSLDKDFVGVEILREQVAAGPSERLVAFVMDDPGVPRGGMEVLEGGVVTSGTHSPMLERGIGLAYSSADRAEPGQTLTIDVRGRPRQSRIVKKPIYPDEQEEHP